MLNLRPFQAAEIKPKARDIRCSPRQRCMATRLNFATRIVALSVPSCIERGSPFMEFSLSWDALDVRYKAHYGHPAIATVRHLC